MPSACEGQVFCGPFLSDDLPTYQAGLLHIEGQWWDFLSRNQLRVILCVFNRSVRFGRKWAYIPKRWFFDGHDQNEDGGYAGQNPIVPQSDTNYNRLLRELAALTILERKGNRYRLNFSINAVDLAKQEEVQARVQSEHRRGGILKTKEGIIKWATQLTSRYLDPQQRPSHVRSLKPEQHNSKQSTTTTIEDRKVSPQTLGDKTADAQFSNSIQTRKAFKKPSQAVNTENSTDCRVTRHTCQHKNYTLEPNKLASKSRRRIKMRKRTASDIMADVSASVSAKAEVVRNKRKVRRTLADRCAIFEQEWARGQRERDSSVPPHRIVGRDRALLKTQIIKMAEGTDLDTDAFAYWVAYNWQAIGATYFAKAKRYPERPVIPWLVKLVETYTMAWQQREHLDTEGTRSQTELMKRAAATGRVQQDAQALLEAKERELLELRAEIAERDGIIDSLAEGGKLENDLLDEDQRAVVQRGAKLKLPDYDDEPAPRRKRRKVKRK